MISDALPRVTPFPTTWLSSGTLPNEELVTFNDATGFDTLIRVRKESVGSSNISVSAVQTRDFYTTMHGVYWTHLQETQRDISALKAVVSWQHSVIDYNSVYNAYLLDQMSVEEFEVAATEFEYVSVAVEQMSLNESIRRVLRLTQIDYQPSDMADLFRCDQQQVVAAYAELANETPSLRAMLPHGVIGESAQ